MKRRHVKIERELLITMLDLTMTLVLIAEDHGEWFEDDELRFAALALRHSIVEVKATL